MSLTKRAIFLGFQMFFFFVWLTVPGHIYAKDFSSFYKTTYQFTPEGKAGVTQEISLINETAEYFVTEYSLSLVGGDIGAVEAYDSVGPLVKTVEIKDQTTIINLKMNEKAVGKGKVLSFILKYQVANLAKKEGNLWRVSIPKLANASAVDDYQLILKIPESYGVLAYLSPNPDSKSKEGRNYLYSFTKEALLDYGVLATFGQHQNFNFKLLYDLKNETLTSKIYEVALIPETDYQSVYYASVEPEPENVTLDVDGNYLATFAVSPGQAITVQAEGHVKIFSQRNTSSSSSLETEYTEPQKYWPADNPKIQALANRLQTPENIYQYVVDTLYYDYESVSQSSSRKGALFALENPHLALCSEFTDLFIALCRAAGIPAREMEGFAYTDNPKLANISSQTDLLHSWPEYFDQKKNEWIMVDPTWEKTSGGLDYFNHFDMTHVVFAVHGINDSYPYPAGSYKNEGSGKQVFITFGEIGAKEESGGLVIEKVSPSKIYTQTDALVEITLRNRTGKAILSNDLHLSPGLSFSSAIKIPKVVPPFGRVKLLLEVTAEDTFSDYPLTYAVNYLEDSASFSLFVRSMSLRYLLLLIPLFTIIAVLTIIFIRKIKRNRVELKPE